MKAARWLRCVSAPRRMPVLAICKNGYYCHIKYPYRLLLLLISIMKNYLDNIIHNGYSVRMRCFMMNTRTQSPMQKEFCRRPSPRVGSRQDIAPVVVQTFSDREASQIFPSLNLLLRRAFYFTEFSLFIFFARMGLLCGRT